MLKILIEVGGKWTEAKNKLANWGNKKIFGAKLVFDDD